PWDFEKAMEGMNRRMELLGQMIKEPQFRQVLKDGRLIDELDRLGGTVEGRGTSDEQDNIYHRHWDYPEIPPLVLPLITCKKQRTRLARLLAEGLKQEIEEWFAHARVSDEVKTLIRKGLHESSIDHLCMFDEVVVANCQFYDGPGTESFY